MLETPVAQPVAFPDPRRAVVPIESPFSDASLHDLAAHTGRDADGTVVWLRGEHDIGTVAALTETIARAMALDDTDLVVDLSEVQFMSAATIGVLMQARELLHRRSRSLTVRDPSRRARRILDVCGLSELLEAHPFDLTRATGAAVAGLWRSMLSVDRADRLGELSATAWTGAPIRSTRTDLPWGRGSAADRPVGDRPLDDAGRRGP